MDRSEEAPDKPLSSLTSSPLLASTTRESGLEEFARSAAYTGIQSPTTALAQLMDRALGTQMEAATAFIAPPPEAEYNSAQYWIQHTGNAAGMIASFYLAGRFVKGFTRRGLCEVKLAEQLGHRGVMGLTLKEAALTGFVHDSILRPTDPQDSRSFIFSRIGNGVTGSVTMTALTASGMGLKGAGVRSDALAGFLSGAPAGFVHAHTDHLLRQGRLATWEETGKSVHTMAVIGGVFGTYHEMRGQHESGRTNFQWSSQGKNYSVVGGESALSQSLARLGRGEAAQLTVREHLGPQTGLRGFFGGQKYGPEQSLLLLHQHGSARVTDGMAATVDLLATCNLSPALRPKSVVNADLLFLRAGKDRININDLSQPTRAGERAPMRLGETEARTSTLPEPARDALSKLAGNSPRGAELARRVETLSQEARQDAGIDRALSSGTATLESLDLMVRYSRVIESLDSVPANIRRGLESLLQVAKVKEGGQIAPTRVRLAERIASLSPEELTASGLEWCLQQKKVDAGLIKDTLDNHLKSRKQPTDRELVVFDETPQLNLDETRLEMERARLASGKEPVDLPGLIERHPFAKSGRDGAEIAQAVRESEFYRELQEHITEVEILAEGNEAVVIRVKGPFVIGEGTSKITVPQMVLKVSQPLRGEWHEHWGKWEERPWDALMVNHEEVTVGSRSYDIYLQELASPGIKPQHQRRLESMLRDFNEKNTGSKNDQYELWDTDARGDAGKQFGYSSLPVSPGMAEGSLWVNLNGTMVRVVLLDPWTICKYGEDGLKE